MTARVVSILLAIPVASLVWLAGQPTVSPVSLDERARAYLHSNCASCHRPEGTGQGTADFRYDAPRMDLCGVEPREGDLGYAGSMLLVPGDPSHSMVALRMRALGQGRMPPIGTAVVDEPGVELVEAWIRAHPACAD